MLPYTGSLLSGALSFFGASLLFAVFPIITADPELSWIVNGSSAATETLTLASHIFFIVPLSIWFCMSASVLVGVAFSIFVYEKTVPRDMINSLVAGGVASCTAGVYFTNPVWPLCLGAACGITQSLVQGLIEKRIAMKSRIFHTNSFTLFGVQGLLGGVFASIFRAVVLTRNDKFVFDFTFNSNPAGYDLAMACLSAALGLAFGILAGIFILITARHEKFDHFDDYTYWVPDDGLRYPQQAPQIPEIPVIIPDTDIYVK